MYVILCGEARTSVVQEEEPHKCAGKNISQKENPGRENITKLRAGESCSISATKN